METKIIRFSRETPDKKTRYDWLLFTNKEISFIQKACNELFYLPVIKDKGELVLTEIKNIPDYINVYDFYYTDKDNYRTGFIYVNRPIENRVLKQFFKEVKVKKRIRKQLKHNQKLWNRFRLEAKNNEFEYPKFKK